MQFFVGTYTKTASRGVYVARLDPGTGALSGPELAAETSSPSFLAFSPDKRFLYAIRDSEAMAAAFAVPPEGLRLKAVPGGSQDPSPKAVAPCHLSVDRTGRVLLATNYHTGIVAAMAIGADGVPGSPRIIRHQGHSVDPVRQAAPHAHSATISPDNRFAIVCDLGLDRMFSYRLDPDRAALEPADPPFASSAPGSGPRHSAFARNGRHAYVISEIASTITVFDYDAARGALAARQTASTLPAGFSGDSSAAEVALHPNGGFLYGSNRGHDSLAVFAIDSATGTLSPVEIVPCGGKAPRHFALSSDGKWLVCAHQDSDTLCSFSVDAGTGRLARVPGTISVPMPTCVLFRV